ncbi:MAG: hypothetical protein ACYC7F_10515 [Gemmatimonadaceae bacterium]
MARSNAAATPTWREGELPMSKRVFAVFAASALAVAAGSTTIAATKVVIR